MVASESILSLDPTMRWYSDVKINRDRSHVLDPTELQEIIVSDSSKFVLLDSSRGVFHRIIVDNNNDNEDSGSAIKSGREMAEALFFTYHQIEQLVGTEKIKETSIEGEQQNDESSSKDNNNHLLAWVGKYEKNDYFVFYYNSDDDTISEEDVSKVVLSDNGNNNNRAVRVSGLREFGDRLSESIDAAILATGNGLVEFHKAHKFCSRCGGKSQSAKAGSCRKCTSCGASTYPRIDVAAIMLITSDCEQYALLGRKSRWPQGRYSTLAGFCEVGETLEQTCAREVQEESGVEVDLNSIRFVGSQPWPFPRSLMAGFRGKAKKINQPSSVSSPAQIVDNTDDSVSKEQAQLPIINVDKNELEDVKWFHKDFVQRRLQGGSTAIGFIPSESEKEFHVPGPSSLARLLIQSWAEEN